MDAAAADNPGFFGSAGAARGDGILHSHGRDGAERRELAPVAFRGDQRSGGQTRDSSRGGKRRGRILRTSRAESVAGSARSARNGFEQAVSRNWAVVTRVLRAAVSNFGGWNTFADLLRD